MMYQNSMQHVSQKGYHEQVGWAKQLPWLLIALYPYLMCL
jgi:hypothetical protein